MTSSRGRKTRVAMTTVEMPASSKSRAMCPTDTWQTGQAGTSKATSMACF